MNTTSGYMPRFKAAGYHLLISALIAAIAAGIVCFVWYPWPYSEVSGGLVLLFLVISVDIVLGPLLTFVVFDRRKAKTGLMRDLVVVAILQMMGLVYGIHAVFVARPVALVYERTRFRVVTAIEVATEELPKALPEVRELSTSGPRMLGTRVAKDGREKFDAITHAMGGMDIGTRPSFWIPYEQSKERVLDAAQPLHLLYDKYPNFAKEIDNEVRKSGRSSAQLKFLPMISKNVSWTVLLDAATAEPVGFVAKDSYF